MATIITDHERNVLAAILARSNMGMSLPDKRDVDRALANTRCDDFVITFCAEFMETEEHEDIFQQEADMWKKQIKKYKTREALRGFHPRHATLVWG